MGKTVFLVINQGGHPVYHDQSNEHVWDRAADSPDSGRGPSFPLGLAIP